MACIVGHRTLMVSDLWCVELVGILCRRVFGDVWGLCVRQFFLFTVGALEDFFF